MEEWIVAVGKHPGIVAGSDWGRVQAMLDVNKSKSYRRPRSNVALLSGLLRCGECGDYMRPKLTNRKNADDELIYTYMCSTKERSHGTVCSMKNCNGNTLDAKIIEEIRKLSADKETLTRLLAQTKKVISGSKEGYDAELALLRGETRRDGRNASNGWWSPCPLPATPLQSTSWSRSTNCIGRARLSRQDFRFGSPHRAEPDAASGVRLPSGMIESFASAVDSATLGGKTPPAAHHRQKGGLGRQKCLCLPLCGG